MQEDGGDKVKKGKTLFSTQKHAGNTLNSVWTENKTKKKTHLSIDYETLLMQKEEIQWKKIILVSRCTGINAHPSSCFTVKQARQPRDSYGKSAGCTWKTKPKPPELKSCLSISSCTAFLSVVWNPVKSFYLNSLAWQWWVCFCADFLFVCLFLKCPKVMWVSRLGKATLMK